VVVDANRLRVRQPRQEAQEATAALRAYHPDTVEKLKRSGELAVDVEWYLTQQILPPISRLCEPIDGTSTSVLAERLGLDGSKFSRRMALADDLRDLCDYVPACKQEDSERFRGVA
jgi:DNA polymerase alpha subunit A